MPRIAGCAIATPHGGLAETAAALVAARGGPGALAGALVAELLAVAATALGGTRPDLIVLATTKADIERWCSALLADAGGYDGGPSWLATELGRRLGAPAFAVSAACASGPLALGVAARWLLAGRAQRVLVLGGDRCGDFVQHGFAALQAIDPIACRPFDAARVGLRLGEAAAAILLDLAPGGAGERFVQGWGASMDANHLTGPTRDGSGLASACRRALARAESSNPALVVAHGTGTRYNDDSESLAYASICPRAPVTAVKGLIGHSLGACGVVEAALAQEFRRRGAAPGVVGLAQQGCAGAITVLAPGEHAIGSGPILAANAGFGGLNGAVVVGERAPTRWPTPPSRLAGRVELGAQGWTRGHAATTTETYAWIEPGAGDSLPKLGAKEVLGHVDASWGRMDLACRALVALGHFLAPVPTDCAVVLVTERGCAATDRAFEQARRAGAADPQRFSYTLPTTPIGELSIRLKLRGPGLALLGATPEQARAVAEDLFSECPAVLIAWIDVDRPPHHARAELWTAG